MESSGTSIQTRPATAPRQASLGGRILARLIWMVVLLLGSTLRWRWDQRHGILEDPSERFIFAVWHNRLAISLLAYRRYVQRRYPGRKSGGLVSASRDGGLLARILELFDVLPIRGSSSRRGGQALREMIAAAQSGRDLLITPDGPRGPRYQAQQGAIAAARLTGLRIVPASFTVRWKVQLRSWDRFQIPLPLALCEIRTGTPVTIPRELSEEQSERLRKELETTLVHLTVDS